MLSTPHVDHVDRIKDLQYSSFSNGIIGATFPSGIRVNGLATISKGNQRNYEEQGTPHEFLHGGHLSLTLAVSTERE